MRRQTETKPGDSWPPNRTLLPLIGAQLSTAGGFTPVPERAVAIGAEVVQIFSSNPRTWRFRPPSAEEVTSLVRGLGQQGIPLYLHTIYLLNLASPDDALRERSAEALAATFAVGALTKASGVVTHVGSHRGDGFSTALPRIQATVCRAMDKAQRSLASADESQKLPPLLLENGSGSGSTVGGDLEELSAVLEALPSHSGLCLDTAHLFAAGYPVHTAGGLERLVEQLRDTGLLERVSLIHLNDSKTPFASKRDQHANPGAGYIGRVGLTRIVRLPEFASIPFVLEVPGERGHGPDAVNVNRVKLMRLGAAGRRRQPARDA